MTDYKKDKNTGWVEFMRVLEENKTLSAEFKDHLIACFIAATEFAHNRGILIGHETIYLCKNNNLEVEPKDFN